MLESYTEPKIYLILLAITMLQQKNKKLAKFE